MPTTGTELINRTRRFVGDFPDEDSLGASCTAAATTLTVPTDANDSYFKNQLIEIDDEVIRVTAVATTTTLTVQRGVRGSTAATHANAATILLTPRFTGPEYLDALNFGIHSAWPWIYKPVVDETLAFVTDTYEYVVPELSPRNELSMPNSRFEDSIGDWSAQGSNTFAVSAAQKFEGSQSALATYQDNTTFATLAFTAQAAVPHVCSAQVYIPAGYDGTQVSLNISAFGNANVQAVNADMTDTDAWQRLEIRFTPTQADLVGQIDFRDSAAPTAGKFIYVDDIKCGRTLGQIRHVAKVSVKTPNDDEFVERRRWRYLRGLDSKLIFKFLDESGSTIRLHGFGPFPSLLSKTDLLDPQWPPMAEYPLVEFAASYLLASGEARRVSVDRGVLDQREQANRVGASMQASNALLARFERRISEVGMPPMPGYPHKLPSL